MEFSGQVASSYHNPRSAISNVHFHTTFKRRTRGVEVSTLLLRPFIPALLLEAWTNNRFALRVMVSRWLEEQMNDSLDSFIFVCLFNTLPRDLSFFFCCDKTQLQR